MKGERKTINTTPVIIAGANAAGTAAGPGSVSYPTAALVRVPPGSETVWFGGSTPNDGDQLTWDATSGTIQWKGPLV